MGRVSRGEHAEGGSRGGAADPGRGVVRLQTSTYYSKANFNSQDINRVPFAKQLMSGRQGGFVSSMLKTTG